jgi:hypothetical protein
LVRLKDAESQNGNRGLMLVSTPPSAGPTMKPMPNAAPMIPYERARVSGVVTSATYAKAVPILADVTPDTMRPTHSQPTVGASAIRM